MRKFIGSNLIFTLTMLVIFILVFVIPLTAHAEGRDSIILGGVSHHFITENHTNSNHNVVAFEYESILAGYMKNSYDNDSFVLAWSHIYDTTKYFDMGIYVGVVRGYDKCFDKFSDKEEMKGKEKVAACPIAAPYMIINVNFPVKPQLTLFGDALTVSARYDF